MISQLNRDGFCMCGCGGKTSLAKSSRSANGYVIGQPVKFIQGHSNMKKPFEDKYMEEPFSGCFLWIGALNRPKGYGQVGQNGKTAYAHRVSWEKTNGKIPDGLVIDHLCRTPSCVNPRHMEVVSPKENLLRGYGPSAIAARKKSCPKCGGAYSLWKTKRFCKKCHQELSRLRYWKNLKIGISGQSL